jgi:CDP-diacylglycerol---glycerol-3-phosphate 3-phosphatidyltransferase
VIFETLSASRWSYANLVSTGILLALAIVISALYLLRVILKGKAQYSRVDSQGGSALLNKNVMEMGYWFIQPLGRLLVAMHITPNQISWTSFLFGILSGAALAYGHFGFGALFAFVAGFLDSLDGIVARLSGVASDAGEVLDATIDRYVEGFFLGGLTIYYHDHPALQVLTLLALMGSFMVSYSSAKAEALQISPPKGSMRRPERSVYLTLGAVLSPISITLFETVRSYQNPIGYPMVMAVGLIAVLANVSAAERMYAIAVEIRRREAEEKKRNAIVSAPLLSPQSSPEAVTREALAKKDSKLF